MSELKLKASIMFDQKSTTIRPTEISSTFLRTKEWVVHKQDT